MLNLSNCEDLWAVTASWIDDVEIMVTETSAETNCQTLQTIHKDTETWAQRHASIFTSVKYELIHFTNQPLTHETAAELVLNTHTVKSSSTCWVLGVYLDSQLTFEAHLQHIQVKATMSLEGLAAIAGSTWGFGLKDLQKLYVAVVLPQILYCCSV